MIAPVLICLLHTPHWPSACQSMSTNITSWQAEAGTPQTGAIGGADSTPTAQAAQSSNTLACAIHQLQLSALSQRLHRIGCFLSRRRALQLATWLAGVIPGRHYRPRSCRPSQRHLKSRGSLALCEERCPLDAPAGNVPLPTISSSMWSCSSCQNWHEHSRGCRAAARMAQSSSCSRRVQVCTEGVCKYVLNLTSASLYHACPPTF